MPKILFDLYTSAWRKTCTKCGKLIHVLTMQCPYCQTEQPKFEILPEDIEIEKLIEDPVYFIEKLFDVELFEYQKEIIRACLEHKLVLVIKGRQIGATYAAACLALWFASVHSNKRVLILALWRKQARRVLDYVKEILYSKPSLLEQLVDMPYGITRAEIRFRNGCIIETSGVSRPTGDNVRSKTAHLLIVDEAVLLLDRQFSAINPVTAYTHGTRLFISTAGAKGCLFHKKVEIARGRYLKFGDWKKGRLFELPACQIKFEEEKIKFTDILCPKQTAAKLREDFEDLGELRFRREYCCEWLGAENQMFPEIKTIKPKQIWQTREEHWAGLDIGEVINPTVLVIIKGNREKAKVVFTREWRKPLKRREKARQIMQILKQFNVKGLTLDVTGIGIGLSADLEELGAPIQGISFNEKVKNKLMFELREALKENWLVIPATQDQLLYELRGYYAIPIEGTNYFKFDYISSDDYVTALALAWHAIPETYVTPPSAVVAKDKRVLMDLEAVLTTKCPVTNRCVICNSPYFTIKQYKDEFWIECAKCRMLYMEVKKNESQT